MTWGVIKTSPIIMKIIHVFFCFIIKRKIFVKTNKLKALADSAVVNNYLRTHLCFREHIFYSTSNSYCYKYIETLFKTLILKVLCFLKMCPIFVASVHNFGRSEDDIIIVKKCLFPIDAYVVWCPTWSKSFGRYLTWRYFSCVSAECFFKAMAESLEK